MRKIYYYGKEFDEFWDLVYAKFEDEFVKINHERTTGLTEVEIFAIILDSIGLTGSVIGEDMCHNEIRDNPYIIIPDKEYLALMLKL